MRILRASLENFASYKTLDFDFTNKALVLIQGPNGAGKSTLCDVIPWILFGRTAKNGPVDDVLPWSGESPTAGTLRLALSGQEVTVTRRRKPNDLYINQDTRGKDIPDTQRLINRLLGLDVDYFLSAAYFHEFSQTATFFMTTPKVRRLISEQLVDLTLAKSLQTKIVVEKKVINIKELESDVAALESQIKFLKTHIQAIGAKALFWEEERETKRRALAESLLNFEADQEATISRLQWQEKVLNKQLKDKVRELEGHGLHCKTRSTCRECGSPAAPSPAQIAKIEAEIVKTKNTKNPYTDQILREQRRENTFAKQLDDLEAQANPHNAKDLETDLAKASSTLALKQSALNGQTTRLTDLELLGDILEAYRSASVKGTIESLQRQTNAYLETHFEGEMRVEFSVIEADKVEVELRKDGNVCSYTQLSKGQRRVLNFCFGVSVMRTLAQNNGNAPSVIQFDEAFDGMDDNMKAKSYGVLKTLESEYSTILVVDHSMYFKSLFDTQYRISLEFDGSVIHEEA